MKGGYGVGSIDILIGLAILIIVLWYFGPTITEERFACGDCAGRFPPAERINVINPYLWPYSATTCVDSVYKKTVNPIDTGLPVLGKSANTPDHVAKTL